LIWRREVARLHAVQELAAEPLSRGLQELLSLESAPLRSKAVFAAWTARFAWLGLGDLAKQLSCEPLRGLASAAIKASGTTVIAAHPL
jgi:hypothetical protein